MLLDRLEALPVGRFHYKLLLVTGLGWLFDSMDTGSSPLSCPYLPKNGAWLRADGPYRQHRPHRHGLGAVVSGTIADRIGRKKVFTITVLLYSIASAFCALSWNYQSLLVFRFLVASAWVGNCP